MSETRQQSCDHAVFACSSLLYVPGSRPDRFAKAKAAGAGLTVIDIEDAVPLKDKQAARDAALAQDGIGDAGWGIRINPVSSAAGIADLAAFACADVLPGHMILPKAEEARDIEIVRAALGDKCPPIIPMIETPRGLRNALAIASGDGVCALMFGGGDFAAELGVQMEWEALLGARQQLVLAGAEAKVPLIDVPHLHLDDAAALIDECAAAKALGFVAKAAIHPRQVPVIERAFAPSASELAEAHAAIAAFEEAGGHAIRHNGKMLEAPMVQSYRAIIARGGKQSPS